jgi:hypothetical protein
VGDERSEELAETLHKKTRPKRVTAKDVRVKAKSRTARAAAPPGLKSPAPRPQSLTLRQAANATVPPGLCFFIEKSDEA